VPLAAGPLAGQKFPVFLDDGGDDADHCNPNPFRIRFTIGRQRYHERSFRTMGMQQKKSIGAKYPKNPACISIRGFIFLCPDPYPDDL
jgi:hypothetical protein